MNLISARGLVVTLAFWQGLFWLADANCFAQAYVPRYGYHRYHGYVPYGYGYGGFGYGRFGGGGTVAEGAGIGYGAAARGEAQLRVATGQYEISHAQAETYQLQAYQEYLKTIKLRRDTYDEFQQAAIQRYENATAADRARVAAYKRDMQNRAAPHRLNEDQFDREHHLIHWPLVLRDSMFDESRYEIDQLFAQRTPENSGAGSNNAAAIQKATDEMMKILDADVNQLDIDQFITGKHFISSLAYEGRFPVGGSHISAVPPASPAR